MLRGQSSIITAAISTAELSLTSKRLCPEPAGGLQSALASLQVSPRSLRGLGDQIIMWSGAELVAPLFTNLSVLVAQALKGVSWEVLIGESAGLVVLVLIELVFELCVACLMMRWNNIPILSGRERGVVRCRILTSFLAAFCCVFTWLPYYLLSLRRAVPGDWQAIPCPYFSSVI